MVVFRLGRSTLLQVRRVCRKLSKLERVGRMQTKQLLWLAIRITWKFTGKILQILLLMKIFLFREVSLAEATALFCPTGLTVVETSAADDQESVDRLLVLALKV